ncbi:MAG TPA: MotA/TolQ/ExbB proton channel family protein [Fibrobacteria bacterium]|nr:MotA/TolQ/ExbB proton channel family protein [Fibrobacteria bacterium]
MIAAAVLALVVSANPDAAANQATKSQKVELARLQRLRDSLVAAHWESRRQELAERDSWQEEFNQVRDSLEAVRQERSQLDLELRRILLEEASNSAPASLPSNPGDPLDGIRHDLSGRLQALRERVDQGIPWKKAERLSAIDSARTLVAQVPSVETALARAVQAWRAEWIRSRRLDSSTGLLPRPEGEPRQGRILVYGALGGWYVSTDGSLRGALLKSGPGSTWEWREDLSDSASAAVAALGSAPLLPMDPEMGLPEGAGFFQVRERTSWKQRLAKFADFREGPLHLAGLWAARAVMALLVFLGALVLWSGWTNHRRYRREEADPTDYEARIMPAMADAVEAETFSATLPDTLAGRQTRLGLRSRNLSPEALEQLLTASESADQRRLERGLAQLGTIGSNAPFIGLFGTVCGILDAFAALGREGAGPQAVMTAIAEALVATAVGLAVAIPAIWIYNTLQSRVMELGARARELRTMMVAASLEAAARGADRRT